ncbi:hypothetical protein BELL_0338g00070 [Botrytis elliptica]|uniref:Uncharacterized protein n=1 Tax=Botrytis elliptica TaxID=278938 RepID=A0A4Z1JJF4_9HELO|nr:hypothetical protein BELL_0338g00070 [Botrytis elliptica]
MSLTERLQTYEYPVKTAVSTELHDLNDPDATSPARIGKQQVTKSLCAWIRKVRQSFIFDVVLISQANDHCRSGGTAGLIYEFLYIWVGTLSVSGVMEELAPMLSTAGEQYYWVYLLAPSESKNFMSHVTGKFPSLKSNRNSAKE